jgi:hypothetical protein
MGEYWNCVKGEEGRRRGRSAWATEMGGTVEEPSFFKKVGV